MIAMAARPGAVDKAYIVGSSFWTRLIDLLLSIECHDWSVAYLLLTLEAAASLDEHVRKLYFCI